jgi:hypothetical protein
MSRTALQQVVDELDSVIDNPNRYEFISDEKLAAFKIMKVMIETDFFGKSFLDIERHQIIEAFKNGSNEEGEAEKYYELTYNS